MQMAHEIVLKGWKLVMKRIFPCIAVAVLLNLPKFFEFTFEADQSQGKVVQSWKITQNVIYY